MLAKRIIACLDVKDEQVVKGVQFRNHEIVGDILELAQRYCSEGADELVFYDITASPDNRSADRSWVSKIAGIIDIPFCVAGGIRTLDDAKEVLTCGADKISINSPALENPDIIDELAKELGSQRVVVGIDSRYENGDWFVYQYTGDEAKTIACNRRTLDWVKEAEARGAGEIVLNCMNQDGMRQGYDIEQLIAVRECIRIPLIASGGAGAKEHFKDAFKKANVDGALSASAFHKNIVSIPELKAYLKQEGVEVRL
ncbi:MAG: imidazole glycerol phosphate synthase subunit HisF [Alphaproteobacteria bacterium]|nr:imidazole glycerol phosphate synthase subunit HisF [Alphaproteobacteria bacterium]